MARRTKREVITDLSKYKAHPLYPYYMLNKNGDIISNLSITGNQTNIWRKMNPKYVSRGYLGIRARIKRGKYKNMLLHRMILETFIGVCPNGYETGHLNGVKTDNRLKNLEWITKEENAYHKELHGVAPIGEKNGSAKLSKQDVFEIIEQLKPIKKLKDAQFLASKYNVSLYAIQKIASKETWKHIPRRKKMFQKPKLKEDIVRLIKKDIKDAVSNKKIAEKFNVDDSTISRIKSGQTWKRIGV